MGKNRSLVMTMGKNISTNLYPTPYRENYYQIATHSTTPQEAYACARPSFSSSHSANSKTTAGGTLWALSQVMGTSPI